eukprot:1087404-Prymnesium_polylepis.1
MTTRRSTTRRKRPTWPRRSCSWRGARTCGPRPGLAARHSRAPRSTGARASGRRSRTFSCSKEAVRRARARPRSPACVGAPGRFLCERLV